MKRLLNFLRCLWNLTSMESRISALEEQIIQPADRSLDKRLSMIEESQASAVHGIKAAPDTASILNRLAKIEHEIQHPTVRTHVIGGR